MRNEFPSAMILGCVAWWKGLNALYHFPGVLASSQQISVCVSSRAFLSVSIAIDQIAKIKSSLLSDFSKDTWLPAPGNLYSGSKTLLEVYWNPASNGVVLFQCVICVNAKATMQTSPCGHRVVCRKCFVKTIQMAVSQRLLPLRCVICRAKILRLKQSGPGGSVLLPTSASSYKAWASSPSSYSVGAHSKWVVPNSASLYSVGAVPNSESLFSMSSGASSLSGVSSVSSATNASQSSSKSGKYSGGSRLGCYPRQPTGSLRRSQTQSMKHLALEEFLVPDDDPHSPFPLVLDVRFPIEAGVQYASHI
uniref:RING-type domain-containing protein n=1 Tax=Timema tahoe TaxID=61484 RepID=A0A7R9IC62_9NEOP|nr:unnamed protein product [Timema tahoe]